MTDPTTLSPAAQAVLDAAIDAYWKESHLGRRSIAAALRAAAEQLQLPDGRRPGLALWENGFRCGTTGAQQALRVIAAELESF